MSTTEREIVTEVPSILDPRVERGAELLDERMPGWATKVNVDTLNVSGCVQCVLGQLFGEYREGAAHFWNEDGEAAMDAGVRDNGFFAHDVDEYPLLTQDWRLAILSRRTSA